MEVSVCNTYNQRRTEPIIYTELNINWKKSGPHQKTYKRLGKGAQKALSIGNGHCSLGNMSCRGLKWFLLTLIAIMTLNQKTKQTDTER